MIGITQHSMLSHRAIVSLHAAFCWLERVKCGGRQKSFSLGLQLLLSTILLLELGAGCCWWGHARMRGARSASAPSWGMFNFGVGMACK